jgi:multiple sugar transport system ATP-binding protein
LEVRDGEFLVLVGPSGCGKSTALRMIAGLEEITSGDLYIGDRRVNDVAPRDRDVAMVFQSYALYPHMTVADNLAFGLRLHKTPKTDVDRRVAQTAAMLGIASLLDRKPGQLSGGQRQRVALGRAIVREPQVFLMDEPLSNLDAKLRVQTRAELVALHHRLATTTIYVTHDQVEAMTMGERIAVLRDGMLQQVDVPQELYDHPANVFVAGFIGSPAMNFLSARIEQDDGQGQTRLRGTGFQVPLGDALSRRLDPLTGRDVLVGVRPEHVNDVADADGAASARASVDVVEALGAEVYVHLKLEAGELVARFDPRRAPHVGEMIDVRLSAESLHLFDPESGISLWNGGETAIQGVADRPAAAPPVA